MECREGTVKSRLNYAKKSLKEYVLEICKTDAYSSRLFPEYEESLDYVLQDDLWYFDKEGITFISNPYELAAYAEGTIYFTVPYEVLTGLKEEYSYDGGFLKGVNLGENISIDLNGDGTADEVAFDVKEPTFRHKMFTEYKGTRKPMADELRQQVPVMKEMLRAMGITVVEKGGYEADDLLGTIAKRSEAKGIEVSVVSGDRDLLQLATDHIKIRIPKTKKTGTEIEDYYAKDVVEKYQVTPIEFIDVKALMGDTSDNIPGVPGIGEKTATALIVQYGSIENAYAHVDEVKPPRASNNLREHYDMAQMSKTLATIEINADIEYDLEKARLQQMSDLYTEEAYVLCKKLEFKHLLGRFEVDTPKNQVEEHFKLVEDKKEAERIFGQIRGKECGFCIFDFEEKKDANTEASGQMNLFQTENVNQFFGMALAFGTEDIYVFVANQELNSGVLVDLLVNSGAACYMTLDLKPQLKHLGMIEKKQVGNLSRDTLFDNVIAAYLLNPLKNEYPYEDLAKDYEGSMIPSRADLLGKLSIEEAYKNKQEEFIKFACFKAYTAWATKQKLETELKPVIRKGTIEDVKQEEYNDKLAKDAIKIFKKCVSKCELEMKPLYAEYTIDRTKVIFYYTADDRVDFRNLLKLLTPEFKMRVELRQIGPREAARAIGGLGTCGRELCCKSHLRK